MPKIVTKVAPTVVGLGCIPMIIHPIDYAVEVGMHYTLRPLIHKMTGTAPAHEAESHDSKKDD